MTLNHIKLFTIAIACAAVVWAALPVQGFAQSANLPELKIMVVNIDAIRVNSAVYKKANEQFIKYSNDINASLQKEDQALRDSGAELNRKRTLLSPEAFAEEEKNFKQRVAAFQRKVQESQKALSQTQADATNKINGKIIEIISKYAEANNVSLVLPESVTILSAKTMNINEYVLKELDKTLPSIEVKAPAN